MADDYGSRLSGRAGGFAAAAGMLVVLLAGGGWLVARGLVAPSAPDGPPATAAVPAADLAFGAPRLVDGVPWGYPLTADGAASAAATVVAVTGQPDVVFDADRFDQVAELVFAPAQVPVQAGRLQGVRAQFAQQGWQDHPDSRRMYHFAVLAVTPTRFDPDGPTATVDVWSMSLVGVGDRGGAVFATSTVELTADHDGQEWQVAGLDSVPGPVPLVDEVASAPGRTRMLLRDAATTVPLPVGDLRGRR